MLKTDKIIVVEGTHDRDAVSQVADAAIIQTDGFRIFKNKELAGMLKELARRRGIILLTDSDRAGFAIRKHLEDAIGKEYVSHAYVPDIYGREKRKRRPSKEGKIGVEGMSRDVILQALQRAGAEETAHTEKKFLTKADFYAAGLSGGPESSLKRAKIKEKLNLPQNLSANRLIDVLNIILDKKQFEQLIEELTEGEDNV